MASSNPNTIILQSNNPDNMQQRFRTKLANGTVTPGELLAWATSGADVDQHATAGGNAEGKKVAVENQFSDHGSGAAIDHAYADNEAANFIFALPGDQLYMFATTSQTIAVGDPLESAGDGNLRKHTPQAVDEGATGTYTIYADAIVGYAAEAVTTTGTRARIKVDIA